MAREDKIDWLVSLARMVAETDPEIVERIALDLEARAEYLVRTRRLKKRSTFLINIP